MKTTAINGLQALLENLRGELAYIDWYEDVPLFWVPFSAFPEFLGIIFWYNLISSGIIQISGYCFILNDIVEYCLQGSGFLFSSVRFKALFLNRMVIIRE